jgi:hypothetical protein
MRITLLIILLSTSIFGQTKIDSIFSIEFPTKPERYEFSEKNEKGITFYSNNENDSFIAMSLIKLDGESKFKNNLPNLRTLKKAYEKMIETQINAMRKKTFVFKDTSQIIINDFIGYKITYQDEHSKNQNAESILLLIDGINFIATYSKVNEFNENNKNTFFNSLKIDSSKKPKQISEQSELKQDLLELFWKGLLLIGIIYVFRKYKKTTGNNS